MSFAQSLRSEAALPSTYGKGYALYLDGDVVRCEAEQGSVSGVAHVEGTVRGSQGLSYVTSVGLDLEDETVLTYSCTCPAHYSYDGICKHGVALAIHYLETTGIGLGERGGSSGAGAGATSGAAAGVRAGTGAGASGSTRGGTDRPRRAMPTSPEVSYLIRSITARKLDQLDEAQRTRRQQERSEAAEPVELDATIMPVTRGTYYVSSASTTSTWLLKLRVRRGKVGYVVKNMDQFVRACRTGAELSHGKNLTFAHVPSAFSPSARAIIDLVEHVVSSQQALFESRYQYQDAGRGTEIKDLPLSGPDVVGLLDILQGGRVTLDPKDRYVVYSYGRYGRSSAVGDDDKPRQIEVLEGDPAIDASLEEADDGGLDLVLPRLLDCFTDGRRLYVVDEGHAWRCGEEFAQAALAVLPALLPTAKVHVGPADVQEFCRTALPALRACTRLSAPEYLDSLLPPEPEFTFRVGLDEDRVFCNPSVSYDDCELSVYEEQRPGQPTRDVVAEYRVTDVVDAYFPNGGFYADGRPPWFDETDDERLYQLMTEGLREMSGLGEVLLSERLRAIEVRQAPQVSVRASLKSGLLDLEVSASGLSPRDLMAYLASYKRKQRYLRLSNGDIMRLDGSVRAVSDLAEGLGVDAAELVGGTVGLPSSRALYVDALLRRTEGVRLTRNDAFRAVVRDFETYRDADIDVPACLRDVLRPYQEEGMRWLGTLERFGFGGILADDMGLGKTLQVIAHILARKEAGVAGETGAAGAASTSDAAGAAGAPGAGGPTLIVCPASLVYNWTSEFGRFAPQLDVVAVTGTKARRDAQIAAAGEHDVLVTSYDLLRRDVKAYAARHFARVVLDEAQYIKNAGTQVAKAAKCLAADVRFALTGTPIENRLTELWSIFDFLMPGTLGTSDAFAKRYADAVEAREEGAARRLQLLVSPFILRRLKSDVLADLPEKNESVVYAQLEGEQAKLYKANQDRIALQVAHELPDEFKKNKLQVLAELTKLRQICCDPSLHYEDYSGGSAKLDTCMELVRSALEGGHGVLLFSQFTSMLDIISRRLVAEKVTHLVLTGATSKEERARLVARFQAGEAKVFLISLKAGGVGLNLTAADVVIHYDPWWNLAAQNQATDRAHRIGQERQVSVFKLIAKDTIEERILAMQESKRDLAESVLGGREMSSATLDREGMLELLGATAVE